MSHSVPGSRARRQTTAVHTSPHAPFVVAVFFGSLAGAAGIMGAACVATDDTELRDPSGDASADAPRTQMDDAHASDAHASDASVTNGCGANLQADLANCGSCGNVC